MKRKRRQSRERRVNKQRTRNRLSRQNTAMTEEKVSRKKKTAKIAMNRAKTVWSMSRDGVFIMQTIKDVIDSNSIV